MIQPTVSVVIPCYNLGAYLDEAVGSVLEQTFNDYEIVVVDDGSTDEATRALLDGYDRPRTRVLRTKNGGLPAARNFGARHTTGRYLCMLDADDRLASNYMAKSVEILESEPAVAFVSHWLRTFGEEERDWKPERCDFPALLDMNAVNGAALVRRTVFESVGGFDEAMRDGCEDWDFWISVVERGYAGRIIPEVLFHYRRRPDSMSRTMANVPGHPALYRHLIQKHPETFRAHLPALVARRERDLGLHERHIEDLALDHFETVGPELTKGRADVEVLTRKLRRQQELKEQVLKQQALETRAEWLLMEHSRLNENLTQAHAEIFEYHARANSAEAEAAELRRSASWKVTRPLRTLVDFWYRLTGRTS